MSLQGKTALVTGGGARHRGVDRPAVGRGRRQHGDNVLAVGGSG